jgi:hypothetical protein
MKRKKLIITALLGVATIVALFAVPSCTEPQLQRADKVFADVNTVGTAVQRATDSPGMPTPVRTAGEVVGGLAGLAVLAWREIRTSGILAKSEKKSVTLRAIADTINNLPMINADSVKVKIENTMKRRNILGFADAIVDEHRTAISSGANTPVVQ